MTRSSNRPVSEAPDSSRRAAISSSATSGIPPLRSATRTSADPVGRSPSIPSRRSASSPPAEWLDPNLLGRAAGVGHRHDVRRERVRAGQLVRLVGGDEADAVGPLDLGEERRECPGPRIGVVEVFEDEEHGLSLAEPAEDAEDSLEEAGLAPLGGRDARPVGYGAEARQPAVELGHEPEVVVDARAEEVDEGVVRQRGQGRAEGPEDRGVRLVRAGGERPAADHEERLGERPDPFRGLADEFGYADAATAFEQHRRRVPAGGGLQGRGEPRERRLAPHEPRAREPGGHDRHSRRLEAWETGRDRAPGRARVGTTRRCRGSVRSPSRAASP